MMPSLLSLFLRVAREMERKELKRNELNDLWSRRRPCTCERGGGNMKIKMLIRRNGCQHILEKKRKLYLGNINNIKDWGWAPEHVSLIYRIMQKNISGDFVIGTGKSVSIRYLLNHVFKTFNLNWKEFVVLDKKYIRAIDVNESRADISKIKFFLKWTPKFYVEDVVKKLILNEI